MNRRDNRTRGPLLANGMAGHSRHTATLHHTAKHPRAAECHQRQRVYCFHHASHVQRVISFLVFALRFLKQMQIYVFFLLTTKFFFTFCLPPPRGFAGGTPALHQTGVYLEGTKKAASLRRGERVSRTRRRSMRKGWTTAYSSGATAGGSAVLSPSKAPRDFSCR